MARSTPGPAKPLPCPEEVAFVELARTVDLLSRGPAHLLKQHDLSPNQYNVLRILRGTPDGLLCGEIAARMISRDPDITGSKSAALLVAVVRIPTAGKSWSALLRGASACSRASISRSATSTGGRSVIWAAGSWPTWPLCC